MASGAGHLVEALSIAVAGAAGCLARHYAVLALKTATNIQWVPVFVVNTVGSFAIGYLAALWSHKSGQMPLAVSAGLLGGFTTFSAFSLDNLQLARNGQWAAFAINVGGQCLLGILMALAGSATAGGFKTS